MKRIGVLKLWSDAYDANRWAVSLDNKTYHNFVEIAPDKVDRWRLEFGLGPVAHR